MLEKKTKAMIELHNMINDGDIILAALSGGSDSCAMLYYLLKQYAGHKIYAAHLNHMIREKDADSDEEFVKKLCAEYNINCFVDKINVPERAAKTKKTLEEAARDERYLFFNRVCVQIGEGNIKIATAHNAADNAETVIFNLSRGSGIDGLCGISPVVKNIIRPILSCTKKEILEYCSINNICYVEDKTNAEEIYTRNFIRHSVVKTLRNRFYKLDENICKVTELLRADAAFIDEYVEKIMRENSINDSANIDLLLSMNKAVRSRVIKKMYDAASGLKGGLEYKHVRYVEDLIEKKENKRVNLPQNIVAEVSYGTLIFKTDFNLSKFKNGYNLELRPGINNIAGTNISVHAEHITEMPGIVKRLNFDEINNSSEIVYNLFNHVYIDFDKIIGSISIRNRRINDEYVFFGQTKSVKKNYINYKIPAKIRDILPVLYDGEDIVWACGLPVGDKVKITEKTKKIISVKVLFN